MKTLILAVSLLFTGLISQAGPVPHKKISTYGIHLFFNETEFIDLLTIEKSELGFTVGHMSVPDDFEGAVTNLQIVGLKITFDLLVPKNNSRPQDMIFHYEGTFFDSTLAQVTGYVTLKNQTDFIASFVGFLR